MERKQTYVYTFTNPQISVSVKASDLADAIDQIRLQFGYEWVRLHIDYFSLKRHKHKLSKD